MTCLLIRTVSECKARWNALLRGRHKYGAEINMPRSASVIGSSPTVEQQFFISTVNALRLIRFRYEYEYNTTHLVEIGV